MVQNSYILMFAFIALKKPCVTSVGTNMVYKIKDFDHALPNRFTLEDFFDRNGRNVTTITFSHYPNCVRYFCNILHPSIISTRSLTVQIEFVTPASITQRLPDLNASAMARGTSA